MLTFENRFKFLKTILLLSPCKLQKMCICVNGDIMHMRITCSVYRCVVSLQSYIAKYWSGSRIQRFELFSRICVNVDRFDKAVVSA